VSAIVCLPVDFRTNSLGLPSLLGEEIDGAPVLYHAVSRLTLSDDYQVVLVFSGPEAKKDESRAREILAGLSAEYFATDAADVPNREFLRRGRLWSINSWRGGIGATSYYDEAGAPAALLAAAQSFEADTVGLLTPDSPYADPSLSRQLLLWHHERIRKARVTVTGVAPGLVPAFFNTEILKQLAEYNLTLAASTMYKPSAPQRDIAATEAHFEADMGLRLAPWRLTCHSLRQLEMMRRLAAAGVSPRSAKSADVIQALTRDRSLAVGAVPAKLEIEPTTRIDAAPFYLRGFAASRPPRDMSVETFAKIAGALGGHRDVVLSFEGLGEPLLHPELARLVNAAKNAGFLGVHVGTYGRLLTPEAVGALARARLDVLSVAVGAHSEETYRAIFGTDGLDGVRAALEAAHEARVKAQDPWPLFVAEITKTRAAERDIEPFFDHWISHSDWPLIRPYNDFAGQIEDHATIHMRTSSRIPCRKIFHEMYIDAEGTAYPCRQDIFKTHPLGNAAEEGLGALWRCAFMEELRAAHSRGEYSFFPLCRNCKDWYYV